jgi:hypothetical protein
MGSEEEVEQLVAERGSKSQSAALLESGRGLCCSFGVRPWRVSRCPASLIGRFSLYSKDDPGHSGDRKYRSLCASSPGRVVRPKFLRCDGVPLDVIRKALMRDSQGRPNSPLGVALDLLAEGAP